MTTSGGEADSCPLENWQAGKTLAECNLRMLNMEDSCDVTFRCSESKEVRAHRYMLMSRSCVFFSMFADPVEGTSLEIPEIEHHLLKQFLVYLYTDDVDVDSDNVIGLLSIARRFEVTGLESKCLKILGEHLTIDNACVILEAAHHLNEKQLFEQALTLVKDEGRRSLQSPGFLALSQGLVDQIVKSDDLVAHEHVIFTAVNNWAEAECERKGREVTPESKTSVLGGISMKIRYPLMKQSFLDYEVRVSGLLSESERLKVIDYILAKRSSTCFKVEKRKTPKTQTTSRSISQSTDPMPRGRFAKTNSLLSWKSGGNNNPKRSDAISFRSNKNLQVWGCQLYGAFKGSGQYTYSVMSYFGSDDNVLSSLVQDKITYTGQGDVFDVLFSRPVQVKADEWYRLAVKVTGPNSYRGKEGMTKMVCEDGVTFDFRNSTKSRNNTDVSHGQIPSLIYRAV